MTQAGTTTGQVLDTAAWSSLTGPHARFAEGAPPVLRYHPQVSPFVAFAPGAGDAVWAALHRLAGPGQVVALAATSELRDQVPADWDVPFRAAGKQLVATDRLVSAPDPEAVRLGADDVEEMLDLVARTDPGPFLPRTHELGSYLGIRREGALVAMAGERLRPPGWTEISAVCTAAEHRGQGLAGRLVRAVAHGIRSRGDRPFLHTAASNVNALRLYGSLGFGVRRDVEFYGLRTPDRPGPA